MSPLASATLFLLATSYLSTVLGNFHSDGFWFRQAETFLLHFVIFLLMFKAQSLEYWYFFCCRLWCVDCNFCNSKMNTLYPSELIPFISIFYNMFFCCVSTLAYPNLLGTKKLCCCCCCCGLVYCCSLSEPRNHQRNSCYIIKYALTDFCNSNMNLCVMWCSYL